MFAGIAGATIAGGGSTRETGAGVEKIAVDFAMIVAVRLVGRRVARVVGRTSSIHGLSPAIRMRVVRTRYKEYGLHNAR